jgi:hypothetical protein
MKSLITIISLASVAFAGAAVAAEQRLTNADYLQAVTCEAYKERIASPDAGAWQEFLKEQSRRRDPMVLTMAEAREDEGRQIARSVRRGGEASMLRARQMEAQCAPLLSAPASVQAGKAGKGAAS